MPRRPASLSPLAVGLGTALALGGCGWEGPPDAPAGPIEAPPAEPDARTLRLGADVPFATLDLPPHSRPHAPEPPDLVPLVGWAQRGRGWQAPLPVRTRNFYFNKPAPQMRVLDPSGAEVVFKGFQTDEAVAWAYDATTLDLVGDLPEPGPGWTLAYPDGVARERALNLATSGEEPADFARATVQAGAVSRTGLLLPAPASATFDLTVPPRAELRFTATLAAPEVADAPPSDGAAIAVALVAGDARTELWSGRVEEGRFEPVTVDLRAHAGRAVTLVVETRPEGDARFDYVFLADPVVTTVKAHPRRAVLVFVDTLRPDHLSTYGYARETSPGLSALAARGARFDQARSVAPWTLPSARTMITGRDPELYFATPTLQARLADAGFATAMFAGNLYLGANFGLNRDWGLHDVELLPRAHSQIDKAIAWLDANEGRDAFMLLHLMDAHLPYKEPRAYRELWAGPRPESLVTDEFHRYHVTGKVRSPEDRQYVRDRYDQSIRYADDQLARLYERLAPSDIVVFVSDHGEEFWEHGGYEHGHSLYDELLRVPMIVRAPGLDPGRVISAPVSLLDVAPTILDLMDQPVDGMEGRSLVPVMTGEPGAAEALSARDLAFGRPLYGKERWGALHQGTKWTAISARESVFELGADPGERKDLVKARPELRAEGRTWLAGALGREVVVGYRIAARMARGVPKEDLVLVLEVPGGVKAVWVGDDPTEASVATVERSEDGTRVTATWPRPWRGTRDVWVVPEQPLAQVTHGLVLEARSGDEVRRVQVPSDKPAELPDEPELLVRGDVGGRGFELGFGITPLPLEGAEALSGFDPSLRAELEAMGYVVGGDEEEPPKKP